MDLFTFLCQKFSAAALSLSPDAEIPGKVKARSIDLFQIWIEGYFSVDFCHNPALTKAVYQFIQENVSIFDFV